MMTRKLQRNSLADQVAGQIRKDIAEGKYKTGDRIPTEPELTAAFGVSRSTLREAVRSLTQVGLLETRQGSGTYVINSTEQDDALAAKIRRASILAVYEVRKIIELEISRLAARRRTPENIAMMEAALSGRCEATKQGDKKAYVDFDIEFHTALADAAQNEVLSALFRYFTGTLSNALEKFVSDEGVYSNQEDFHRRILEAVKNRQEEDAIYWTRKNIETTAERLKELTGAE